MDVEASAQGVESAFFVHHLLDALKHISARLVEIADQLAIVVPPLGLGGADKGNDRLGPQAQRLVVVGLLGGEIAMRLQQDGFDVFFKRGLGGDFGHIDWVGSVFLGTAGVACRRFGSGSKKFPKILLLAF